MAELHTLTAIELLDGYRSGAVSPVDATRAALSRIEDLNPRLNAFCLVDGDGALASAKAAETRWAKAAPAGALDGVPVSIKDLLLTKGWPTLFGSRTVDPDQALDEDAPVVARLREAGAVLLGKTTTPEFGHKGVTDSELHGITRNSWNADLTPGGSSGGAGAAVATGMGPLAIGTDGGGSVRTPSNFCGLVGLKPTAHRLPIWPPSTWGPLATPGPMARTVGDTALLFAVMARPGPRDPLALPSEDVDYRDGLERGIDGLRVAYSADLGYARVHPDVARIIAAAAKTFAGTGATVEEADPGFDNPLDIFRANFFAGSAASQAHLSADKRKLLDPLYLQVVEAGEKISAKDYVLAQRKRAHLMAQMGKFHERYDLLILPTCAVPPFPVGQPNPDDDDGGSWEGWFNFTFPFNVTGQSAMTVPCGFTDAGLPVGLQIVGASGQDRLVLRAAAAFERLTGLAGTMAPT